MTLLTRHLSRKANCRHLLCSCPDSNSFGFSTPQTLYSAFEKRLKRKKGGANVGDRQRSVRDSWIVGSPNPCRLAAGSVGITRRFLPFYHPGQPPRPGGKDELSTSGAAHNPTLSRCVEPRRKTQGAPGSDRLLLPSGAFEPSPSSHATRSPFFLRPSVRRANRVDYIWSKPGDK